MTKKFLGCFVLVCSVLVATKTASAQETLTYKPWTAETIMQGSASAPVGFFKSGTLVSYSLTQTDEDTYQVFVNNTLLNPPTTKRPDPNLAAQAIVIRSISGMVITKRGGPITVNWDVTGTAVDILDTPLGENEEYDMTVPKRRVEDVFIDNWLLRDSDSDPNALTPNALDDMNIPCAQQVKIYNEFWMRKAKTTGPGCNIN
jgi:hypothetical protein